MKILNNKTQQSRNKKKSALLITLVTGGIWDLLQDH